MGHSKLTINQESFAQAIANKTYKFHWEAYEAIYNSKKMSKNAIYVEACRLIQNPKVSLRIKEIETKIKGSEKLTLDDAIIRISKRNEVTAKDYFNDDGTFKNISELTDDQAVFITGLKVSEIWGKGDDSGMQIGRVIDVKIESLKDLLDMIIRHWGGYAKETEGSTSNLELIKEIVDKIKQ